MGWSIEVARCPLLAPSGHRLVRRTCLLLTQSGHSADLLGKPTRDANVIFLREADVHTSSVDRRGPSWSQAPWPATVPLACEQIANCLPEETAGTFILVGARSHLSLELCSRAMVGWQSWNNSAQKDGSKTKDYYQYDWYGFAQSVLRLECSCCALFLLAPPKTHFPSWRMFYDEQVR